MYISLVRFTETSHSVQLERALTALFSITVKFVVLLKWYQINIFYFVTFWYSIRVRLLSLLALTRLHVCNVAYHHHHHHHHVQESLGVFPVAWSSRWSWSFLTQQFVGILYEVIKKERRIWLSRLSVCLSVCLWPDISEKTDCWIFMKFCVFFFLRKFA
jgi:hypothetical protein